MHQGVGRPGSGSAKGMDRREEVLGMVQIMVRNGGSGNGLDNGAGVKGLISDRGMLLGDPPIY